MRAAIAAILVVAAAACWRDTPATHASVAAVPEAPPSRAQVVTDVASAQAAIGTKATVSGTARTAKLAAVVVLADGTPVYCLELERWPAEQEGAPVTADGTLETTDDFVASPGAAGTNGPVWVLRNCKLAAP
jgi:hypothetical protein